MRFLLFFLFSIILSCGGSKINNRDEMSALDILRRDVELLKDFAQQYQEFQDSDFAACSGEVPPFAAKFCQITNASTDAQRAEFTDQVLAVATAVNDKLYGAGCTTDLDPDCPKDGSISSQLSTNRVDILNVEMGLASIRTMLLTFQSRLDDFDGTGQSIEVVIGGIKSEIGDLTGRLGELEASLEKLCTSFCKCGKN